MKTLMLAAVFLLTLGCATQPIPHSQASDVPGGRIATPHLVEADNNKIEVRFVRDTGFMASGVLARIAIDEEQVADMERGERLKVWLPKGIHQFSMTGVSKLFGVGDTTSLEMKIDQGRIYSFRVGFSSADGPMLQPLTY